VGDVWTTNDHQERVGMIFHYHSRRSEEAFSPFLFVKKSKLENDGSISKLQQLLGSALVCKGKGGHAVSDNRYLIGSAPIFASQECLGNLGMNDYMIRQSQSKSRPNNEANNAARSNTFPD